jgi:1,2-phenylacetyl-CoA epoxidase catalytic subunit
MDQTITYFIDRYGLYRQAMQSKDYETAKRLARCLIEASMDISAGSEGLLELAEESELMDEIDDAFHRRYKDAVFENDQCINIWRDAWAACLEHKKQTPW